MGDGVSSSVWDGYRGDGINVCGDGGGDSDDNGYSCDDVILMVMIILGQTDTF